MRSWTPVQGVPSLALSVLGWHTASRWQGWGRRSFIHQLSISPGPRWSGKATALRGGHGTGVSFPDIADGKARAAQGCPCFYPWMPVRSQEGRTRAHGGKELAVTGGLRACSRCFLSAPPGCDLTVFPFVLGFCHWQWASWWQGLLQGGRAVAVWATCGV